MHLQIFTPEKTVFDADAESVSVPGEAGGFEVLQNHAPILSSLVPGDVCVTAGRKKNFFHISFGFFEFSHNRAVLLSDSAERPGEIDVERARAARERAEKRLAQAKDIDLMRAQHALMRALTRERFAQKFPGGLSG